MGPPKIGQESRGGERRQNRFKIGPRTSLGVHPTQSFTPDRFFEVPGPDNGLQGPENAKNLPEPVVGHLGLSAGSKLQHLSQSQYSQRSRAMLRFSEGGQLGQVTRKCFDARVQGDDLGTSASNALWHLWCMSRRAYAEAPKPDQGRVM